MWGCKLSRAIEAVKWKWTRDLSSLRRAVILQRKLWRVDKHPALPSSITLVLLTGPICGSRTETCVLQTWWLGEGVFLLGKTSLINVLLVHMCINFLLEMSEGKLNLWLLSNEVSVGIVGIFVLSEFLPFQVNRINLGSGLCKFYSYNSQGWCLFCFPEWPKNINIYVILFHFYSCLGYPRASQDPIG